MPFIEKPAAHMVPGDCLVHPGRRRDEDGFFLLPTQLDSPLGVYSLTISATGLRRLAQQFPQAGLVPKAELDDARAFAQRQDEELDRLRRVEAEYEAFKQNLAGLEAEGFRVAKKRGPQVKPEEVHA